MAYKGRFSSVVSIYKRKYETAAEISKILPGIKDVKDLASLYYVNAELIEISPDLKREINDKKNALWAAKQNNQLP